MKIGGGLAAMIPDGARDDSGRPTTGNDIPVVRLFDRPNENWGAAVATPLGESWKGGTWLTFGPIFSASGRIWLFKEPLAPRSQDTSVRFHFSGRA